MKVLRQQTLRRHGLLGADLRGRSPLLQPIETDLDEYASHNGDPPNPMTTNHDDVPPIRDPAARKFRTIPKGAR